MTGLVREAGAGIQPALTGDDEYEVETFFPMLGTAIRVTVPGEPSGGLYLAELVAARHNAGSPEDTQDGSVAHARFPAGRATR